MTRWLPQTENKIPLYPYHSFGVAGIVLNKNNQILLVSEKRANRDQEERRWRIPGGALDPGESIGECAMREILEGMSHRTTLI